MLRPNEIPRRKSTEKQVTSLVQGKKPRTFGIKKAPVHLWIEVLYFIIHFRKSNKLLNSTTASP